MRYATPSPAGPPACERSKPFFLNTKEDPMSTPLTMARTMPTILRLEFDWVVLLLERVDNVEDIGARLRVVVWLSA